jgi:hypothetical protein
MASDDHQQRILGFAPFSSQEGDFVCVLRGCSVPVILRRTSGDHYVFVGEAYVHGTMDGEIMDQVKRGRLHEQQFAIH